MMRPAKGVRRSFAATRVRLGAWGRNLELSAWASSFCSCSGSKQVDGDNEQFNRFVDVTVTPFCQYSISIQW